MSTRKCKKCGWEYPATQPGVKCKICGEPFDEVVCRCCGKLVSGAERVPERALCRDCHNAEERMHMDKYWAKRAIEYAEQIDAWMAKIALLPKNYPTLTEAQWLQACRYFKGCAMCGASEIDTRGFFIPFKQGGRYCAWNVIPLCTECANRWKDNPNPFRIAFYRDITIKSTKYRSGIERTVEYLGGIIDDARTTY